jgi:hypothetical protein
MGKRATIAFDNNHTLVLRDQEDDVDFQIGTGLANRQNGAIQFRSEGRDLIVPLSRVLFVEVQEEDEDVR